jgi:malate synthase
MAVVIKGAMQPGYSEILSAEALAFLEGLHKQFEGTRQQRLADRISFQNDLDAGRTTLDFPTETADIRAAEWQVAPIPADLLDRRVEITGPTDRKMTINALNSGAKMFMADLEDANAPSWDNMIQGQINLRDAVAKTISFHDTGNGKDYALGQDLATLLVRPRGWHLDEKHILVDGVAMSGSLVDFGLYFFHNAKYALSIGTGPYFYLPKMEHYLEARLWNEVFVWAQDQLGVAQGSCKATVLIETLPATFHAEEIIYELREHMAGLNCGRWDYIFSYIKKHRNDPTKVLPDRVAVTMTVPFMRTYSLHVIKTCHKRGAFAMGGMAAQIPIRNDEAANNAAFEKLRTDKEREATDGHDGTWVAHPGMVSAAMDVFNEHMPTANQISRQRDDAPATAAALTAPCDGPKSMGGLLMNINVGIGYIAAWLGGNGAVPLHNLMEDAATAEISRAQIWQWRKHGVKLDSGEVVDAKLVRQLVANEIASLKQQYGEEGFAKGHYGPAAKLLQEMVLADELAEFLTIPAYDLQFAPAA